MADGLAPWDLGSHADQVTSTNQWRIKSDVILRFQRIMGRGRVEVRFLHYMYDTNTKSLAKEFSKILIFEYFQYLQVGFDVFFDADSESPRMT